ncbi:type IV toxin-antitoxin system AbiEi family antitoxin domain-containing protein [Gordonia sp. NPDC062954]|uniref:type IV toxin-antitoxin system AbiEi family antitoxin domain-containing protein n=1 Tax=Gordonia sp. NPDC062954 TaxID=3364003 RepID=UPI0037CC969C
MTPTSPPRLSPQLARQALVIDDVLAQQWGFITTGQCLRLGLTRTHITRLRQPGYLDGVAHGVMRRPRRVRSGVLYGARLAWVAAGGDLFPAERLAAEWPDYVVTATTALALHGLAEAVSLPQLAVINTRGARERWSTAEVGVPVVMAQKTTKFA